MPTIFTYVQDFGYSDIDVDVDEFLNVCNPDDTQDVINSLIANGDLKVNSITDYSRMSASEKIFEEHLTSISGRWNQLTSEEEETILKIGARFRYL